MAEAKKYYWLKLPKDFFKRHDITYMLSLPLGEKIVVFYLKMMTESIDHDGRLRFNKELPYTNAILASIMHVDEDFCNRSMNLFIDLGLIEIDEDETIIMTKVAEMIGSASDTDEARRSRRYRERKKAERDETSHENVTPVTEGVTKEHESKSKSKSKSIERNTKERNSVPLYAFGEFQNVLLTTEEHDKLANEFGLETTKCVLEELSGYIVEHPRKYTNHYLTLRNWLLKRREEKKPQPIHCPPKPNPYDIDWSKV